MTKAMLASDWNPDKLVFPVFAQPKIDGVRALHTTGGLTGRSLKKLANVYTTELFSNDAFAGMDGEMIAEHETHPDLCRITTSALGTIKGQPWVLWQVFDYVTPETVTLPYHERYSKLSVRVSGLRHHEAPHISALGQLLRVVPAIKCENMAEVVKLDDWWLDAGYEGTILRDPMGAHKAGRSTVREGGLLRIKRFVDFEFEILELLEGESNTNTAQINELGMQYRTSHKAGMVPNGMVGAMMGRLIDDVVVDGTAIFKAGDVIKVGAGNMSHEDRMACFSDTSLLLGKIGKGKMFPKGIKDKPRFPTFQTLRDPSDL